MSLIRADQVKVGNGVRLKGYRTQVTRENGTVGFETPTVIGIVEEVVRITETEIGFIIAGQPVAMYPAHELVEVIAPDQ